MKKVFVVLAVLALAVPALAAPVTINCSAIGQEITVSFTNPSGKVRAFGLEITVNRGIITDVNELDVGYWVHPSSIYILGNVVQHEGSAVVDGNGTSAAPLVVEMASLYASNDPLHPTPPGQTQDLLKFMVSENDCTVTVTEHAVSGGVVNEDGSSPGITGGSCSISFYPNTCWNDANCPGQKFGDATCDGSINYSDFFAFRTSLWKCKGVAGYNCCGDFDRSGCVNYADFFIFRSHLWDVGYLPVTGTQSCPP